MIDSADYALMWWLILGFQTLVAIVVVAGDRRQLMGRNVGAVVRASRAMGAWRRRPLSASLFATPAPFELNT